MGEGHIKDLTGQLFGNLQVIKFSHVQPKRGAYWECRCACGNMIVISSHQLRTKHHHSCSKGACRIGSKRHGLSTTPEYKTVKSHWHVIFTRSEEKYVSYKNMPFCDSWNPREGGDWGVGAKWIIDNLGPKPGSTWSLDIIKHDLGFVPGNLRWANRFTQARNKQYRMLGQVSDLEFALEAQRRGYIRIPDLTLMRPPDLSIGVN